MLYILVASRTSGVYMSKSLDAVLSVRRAEEDEAELVREIVCAAYSKWISVIGREPTPMTVDFNKTVREHDVNLAIVAGEVCRPDRNMARRRSFLDRKYSDPPSPAGNGNRAYITGAC